ncbi:hypothetical protein D3C80_1508560 [compost metagenome]
MGQGAFRAGEVDQDIEIADNLFQVIADGNAQCTNASQFAGIGANQARTRALQRCPQYHTLCLLHGLDQLAPHAATGTRNRDADL